MNENHSAALIRAWDKIRTASTVPAPAGANPSECEPFRPHAVDTTQRLNCARRSACLTFAMNRQWRAFSCESCSVRETTVRVLELRRGEMLTASWPDAMEP